MMTRRASRIAEAIRREISITGKVAGFHMPGGPGIQVDTHVYEGYEIPPYYDSLIAKLIAWGRTQGSYERMERAISKLIIETGNNDIVSFKVIRTDAFQQGNYHTSWIEEYVEQQNHAKPIMA